MIGYIILFMLIIITIILSKINKSFPKCNDCSHCFIDCEKRDLK